MNDAVAKLPILWLDNLPRRPLCDVPWLGNALVLSDGRVLYCCYSEVAIGNVNEQTFGEIWNGPVIRKIRQGLAQQTIPTECATPSCPVFRGDRDHFLVKPPKPADPVAAAEAEAIKVGLKNARLRIRNDHEAQVMDLELSYTGPSTTVDVYVAVRDATSRLYFLPELDRFPAPCRLGLSLPTEACAPLSPVFRGNLSECLGPAPWSICLAVYGGGEKAIEDAGCYFASTFTWSPATSP